MEEAEICKEKNIKEVNKKILGINALLRGLLKDKRKTSVLYFEDS